MDYRSTREGENGFWLRPDVRKELPRFQISLTGPGRRES